MVQVSAEYLGRKLNLTAKLKRLPALTSLSLSHNRLRTISALYSVICAFTVGPAETTGRTNTLRSLTIQENPICSLALFRPLILRLFLVSTTSLQPRAPHEHSPELDERRDGKLPLGFLNGVAVGTIQPIEAPYTQPS